MISRQGRAQTCVIAWRAGWANGSAYHRTPKARESILDHRTTIGCAVRAGKLYTLDFQPVGHDIPIDQPPPRHWNCRSILVPMSPDFAPPGDGQDPYTESLDAWLKRQPENVQDELLGPTRAALWRSGAIDARGLLGRGGETLSVAELTAKAGPEAKVMTWAGAEKYRRLADGLTQAMREAGHVYGLTEPEMIALRHYTEDGYHAMNAALREGRAGRATLAMDVLNSALAKLPAYTGTVVRRATLPADVLAKYVPGKIVTEDAFTSATRGAKDVFAERPHRFVIRGLTGRDISPWSAYSRHEQEVLFGAPRRFYVKTRVDMGQYIEIELEELP